MSAFVPASRRFYSSIFSSKSGSGRYFSSTRASKSPVIASARSKGSPSGSGSKSSQDGSVNSKDVNHVQPGENAAEVVDAQSGTPASPSSPSGEPGNTVAPQGDSRIYNTPLTPNDDTMTASWLLTAHPTVNSNDFKLHQFFSLHRPLLLLSDPSLILHSAPSSNTLLSVSEESDKPLFTSNTSSLPSPPPNLLSAAYSSNSVANAYYDISETSPDADAEAARQLSRALAMTKAGAMVEWEGTLRALGLDVEMDPERVVVREQMERELEEVIMDSTKRKRRKKIKKHKLKKRRRLTRSTRLKIGR